MLVTTAALVAGCDAVTDTSSTPTATGTTTAPATGEDALTARVRVSLAEAEALADLTRARVPGLRDLAAPYVALHRAHGAMLGGLPSVGQPRFRRKQARRDLLQREEQLQRELVDASLDAQSGALAQALAAMAAAVAQRREVA